MAKGRGQTRAGLQPLGQASFLQKEQQRAPETNTAGCSSAIALSCPCGDGGWEGATTTRVGDSSHLGGALGWWCDWLCQHWEFGGHLPSQQLPPHLRLHPTPHPMRGGPRTGEDLQRGQGLGEEEGRKELGIQNSGDQKMSHWCHSPGPCQAAPPPPSGSTPPDTPPMGLAEQSAPQSRRKSWAGKASLS